MIDCIRALGPRRQSRRWGIATFRLIAVIVVAGFATLPTPAHAAPDSGPDGAVNSLTITQTSVVTDLAPGRPPVILAGVITNNGPDSTHITAIDVEITSVTRALDAAPGTCTTSDYELVDARMLVGRTLAASGGSVVFSGASLGFINKTTQQDACQRATVHLLYTAVSNPPASPSALPTTGVSTATGTFVGVAITALIVGAVLARRSKRGARRHRRGRQPS